MKQAIVLLAFAAFAGCRAKAATTSQAVSSMTGVPRAEPFIALERDFQNFRTWESLDVPENNGVQGVTHTAGRRREYLNRRPPAGAKAFPVATMFVKEIETGAPEDHKVFAMVKRGGGYNGQGAPGWEWFELRERKDGSFAIAWRGINAPKGESYGGDPMGGCNGCHGIANDNDFVKAEAAALTALARR